MANWKLETVDKKSVNEVETWVKGDYTILRTITYRWGCVFIDSDEKPDIDLANPDGMDILLLDYDIELGDLIDGDINITYPDDMTDSETEELEERWEEDGDFGWEEGGWELEDTELIFNGELDLINMDEIKYD